MAMKKSPPTSIRLSEEAAQLKKLLAERLGVSEAAVIELAIRELAEKKGIQMQDIQMKKLIGKDINGKSIIVECEDKNAVAKAKREYAKVGVALESYDKAIQEEAERLLLPDGECPDPKYRF